MQLKVFLKKIIIITVKIVIKLHSDRHMVIALKNLVIIIIIIIQVIVVVVVVVVLYFLQCYPNTKISNNLLNVPH